MAVRAAFLGYFRFSFKFNPIPFLPLFSSGFVGLPRTELSSAVSQGYLVLYIFELGHSPPRLGLLDSLRVSGPDP